MVQPLQPKRNHLQRHDGHYDGVYESIVDDRINDRNGDDTDNDNGSRNSNSSGSSGARPLPEIKTINEALVFKQQEWHKITFYFSL